MNKEIIKTLKIINFKEARNQPLTYWEKSIKKFMRFKDVDLISGEEKQRLRRSNGFLKVGNRVAIKVSGEPHLQTAVVTKLSGEEEVGSKDVMVLEGYYIGRELTIMNSSLEEYIIKF